MSELGQRNCAIYVKHSSQCSTSREMVIEMKVTCLETQTSHNREVSYEMNDVLYNS